MLKILNGVRLVRFEPEVHTAQLYLWYYSGDYQEFYRQFPTCPSAAEISAAAQGKTFMILNDQGVIVGTTMHFKEDDTARNFELATLIDKQFEKQGYAFTALKIILNWKFNFCNLYKAKINVVANNRRLCNALETFGATCESRPRKECFFDGEFHDIAGYAMFKTEFNKKYRQEFLINGLRLDAPIQKENGHGQEITEAIQAPSGAPVRLARAAS